MKNEIIEVNGIRWMVHEAVSEEKAMEAIAWARVRGSVGTKLTVDDSACGGSKRVEAYVENLGYDIEEVTGFDCDTGRLADSSEPFNHNLVR